MMNQGKERTTCPSNVAVLTPKGSGVNSRGRGKTHPKKSKCAINRESTTTSLTPVTVTAEAQISPLNQLLSKSLDSSADCIRHSAITAAPAKQSLSKPKLIRAKVLSDGASCCRQHRYRTHSGSVMCRLAPQQSRLQHLKKNICIVVLWCHTCCLCREQSCCFFFDFFSASRD